MIFMLGVRKHAALASVLSLATMMAAHAQEPRSLESESLPMLVLVEPGDAGVVNPVPPPPGEELKVLQGTSVRIRGIVASGLAGKPLLVTVTPPQRPEPPDPREEPEDISEGKPRLIVIGPLKPLPPETFKVTAAGDGSFATTYKTQTTGGHHVEVRDAGGTQSGSAQFDVESATEFGQNLREELEKEAKVLLTNAKAALGAVRPRIRELPASPARDEALAKAEELSAALDRLQADGPSELVPRLEHLGRLQRLQRTGPGVRAAVQQLIDRLEAWRQQAADANRKAPQQLAELKDGNVVCDQLDVIADGLRWIDFYVGLFATPGSFMIDWAKENVPTRLVALVPEAQRSQARKETIESSWKGIVGAYPIAQNAHRKTADFAVASTAQKIAIDLAGFMASRLFDRYCQTFQGPVSGSMVAEFQHYGSVWWTYWIEIFGELILRYPKDAKGEAIALTGEFLGNGTRFKSWDNAIPVLFPGLAKGALFREVYRIEPQTMHKFPLVYSSPKTAPSMPKPLMATIGKGGRSLSTPAFFRIPVRGDLRGDTLRIELQPAVVDFAGRSASVKMLILPVLSMRVTATTYELPYAGAHLMLFRAMNDAIAEFKLQRSGKTMFIERRLQRERVNGVTKGTYDISIKACNPSC